MGKPQTGPPGRTKHFTLASRLHGSPSRKPPPRTARTPHSSLKRTLRKPQTGLLTMDLSKEAKLSNASYMIPSVGSPNAFNVRNTATPPGPAVMTPVAGTAQAATARGNARSGPLLSPQTVNALAAPLPTRPRVKTASSGPRKEPEPRPHTRTGPKGIT